MCVLEASPLFKGIESGDIKAILARLSAVRREYNKGETIIWEGEAVSEVGILLWGSARSYKCDVSGNIFAVTMLGPGSYLGVLLAASHDRTSPVSVQALSRACVLFIPINSILERSDCPHHTRLLGNLLDGIAEKALVLHDRNDCLIRPTIREKVITFLTREARSAGSRSFAIPMGRAAMAEYLDVDRSALSRELSWMKHDGIIKYEKNRFELL